MITKSLNKRVLVSLNLNLSKGRPTPYIVGTKKLMQKHPLLDKKSRFRLKKATVGKLYY